LKNSDRFRFQENNNRLSAAVGGSLPRFQHFARRLAACSTASVSASPGTPGIENFTISSLSAKQQGPKEGAFCIFELRNDENLGRFLKTFTINNMILVIKGT
jgi:hypothetical protein